MQDENLSITLKRSNRKSIGIEVTLTGEVIVRAPYNVSKHRINSFITKKQQWINRHRDKAEKRSKKYPKLTYANGDTVYLYGQKYTLAKAKNERTQILFKDDKCMVKHFSEDIKEPLNNWYKESANEYLASRCAALAHKHGFDFSSTRVTNAKTRWGSCGTKNSINFSWRLIKTPKRVIDYVILHELVHTEYKNHSQSFWARVGEVDPSYKDNRMWLKQNALILLRD